MSEGNGHRRPTKRKVRGELFSDDSFSRELKRQGKDGSRLRTLYLQNEFVTYQKRVMDEPIHY